MEDKIKIGDVVRLNSGGPDMTVEQVTSGGASAQCVWSVYDDNKVERYTFPVACLTVRKAAAEAQPPVDNAHVAPGCEQFSAETIAANAKPSATSAAPDINAMVDRFLGWSLPKTFGPDCGISFDGRKDDEWNKNKPWPIGTNLLTAVEAKAMFEYCLAGGAKLDPPGQAVTRLMREPETGRADCSANHRQ